MDRILRVMWDFVTNVIQSPDDELTSDAREMALVHHVVKGEMLQESKDHSHARCATSAETTFVVGIVAAELVPMMLPLPDNVSNPE